MTTLQAGQRRLPDLQCESLAPITLPGDDAGKSSQAFATVRLLALSPLSPVLRQPPDGGLPASRPAAAWVDIRLSVTVPRCFQPPNHAKGGFVWSTRTAGTASGRSRSLRFRPSSATS